MISATTALLLGGAALLIFGPKRLPEVARSLGRSVSEFKAGADEAREAFRQGASASPASAEPIQVVVDAAGSLRDAAPPVERAGGDGESRSGT